MIVINLREGRSGYLESSYAIAITLFMSGLFVFDSQTAYSGGNSTYLSLPLACAFALIIFLFCGFAMKKTKTSDLHSLLSYGAGKVPTAFLCVYIVILLIASASLLLSRFLSILYSYFFQISNYYNIAVYMFLVMIILSFMGFETISRMARILGIIVILVQILLLVNSSSGYEAYKIYPIAGDGAGSMLKFSLRSVSLFFPAFIVALTTAKGMHGISNGMKNAVRAATAAIIICGVSQLLLGFSYTYSDLSKLYMPLYRMSMVTGVENFIFRLDKASAFIWTGGALFAASYYAYGASLLYCRAFSQTDIRPAAACVSLITTIACLLSHLGKLTVSKILEFIVGYGTYLMCIPILAAAVAALIKYYVKERKNAG